MNESRKEMITFFRKNDPYHLMHELVKFNMSIKGMNEESPNYFCTLYDEYILLTFE